MSAPGQSEETPQPVLLAFAPLHKLGLGLACGIVCGVAVFLATAILLLKGGPVIGPRLALLGHYFLGYSVTWPGAFVGLLWGFGVGFVIGWLVAFLRNLLLALNLILIKSEAEMSQYRDFLDHI